MPKVISRITLHIMVTSQAQVGLELELHNVRILSGIHKHVGVKILLLMVQNCQMGILIKLTPKSPSHLMQNQDGAIPQLRLHNNAELNDCQTKSFMTKTGSENRLIGRRLLARSPLVRVGTGVSHREGKALDYRHQ
jgi:hypothetical protein